MGLCHFVVGGVLSGGREVPGGVDGNPNVLIEVSGAKANTVIAFCYLLIIIYALTLAPVCWVYAAEVWSLETRATGMGIAANGNWLVSKHLPTHFESPADTCLIVQLRSRPIHSSRFHQHQMGHVHCLRSDVLPRRHSILLHVP